MELIDNATAETGNKKWRPLPGAMLSGQCDALKAT